MNDTSLKYCGEQSNFRTSLMTSTKTSYFEYTRIFKDKKVFTFTLQNSVDAHAQCAKCYNISGNFHCHYWQARK